MRVKRGFAARRKRKKVLKLAKGFRGSLHKLYRPAHQAVTKALSYARIHRRLKKRTARALWITRLNAALKEWGGNYRHFIKNLKDFGSKLNRKILSQLAIEDKKTLKKIVEKVKG